MSTVQLELVDETEVKIAVLSSTYHGTRSKPDFLMKIEQTTHIPLGEADLAWEIFDYLEWRNGNEN